MKEGDRVKHPRLGIGVILFVGKTGCLVDYSNRDGVLVRGSRKEDLELIDE